uniref:Uncharacterized protein n=1 Tax=Rousettus aegyptiacus TaxID=9407 RepID=A0A7J8FJT0_ROUAE|nr:hypothetical protein HJG63_011873 [Rousettus aegyptiacus]
MARLLLQGWGKVRQGESQQQAQGGPRLRRPAGAGPVLKENGGGGLLQAVSRAPGSSLPSDPISQAHWPRPPHQLTSHTSGGPPKLPPSLGPVYLPSFWMSLPGCPPPSLSQQATCVLVQGGGETAPPGTAGRGPRAMDLGS